MTRVLVAPDKFKGTFGAASVADAVADGLESGGLEADRCPIADGGEGTAAALLERFGGTWEAAEVHGPLGARVAARFAVLAGGDTVALDLAEASGLALVDQAARDATAADSRGTGELIAAAVATGARTVLVGSGGSASVDGGRGAIEALREAGGPGAARLVVLCDVHTPWERAASVFGPQKGAGPEEVVALARRLDAFADELPRDPRGVPSTGGSGGFTGGLWAAFDAVLEPGAAYVLDAVGFDGRAASSDAVVVGEGGLDDTSGEGKAAGEAARRAGRAGVPCHAVVGRNTLDADAAKALGLADVREATTLEALHDAGLDIARRMREGR